jgi:hypothetical protein
VSLKPQQCSSRSSWWHGTVGSGLKAQTANERQWLRTPQAIRKFLCPQIQTADYAGHAHELARRYIAAGSAPACHFPIAFTPGNSGWSQ